MATKKEPAMWSGLLDCYQLQVPGREIPVDFRQVSDNRYVLTLPEHFMEGCKDVILRIHYRGDIGHAFIDGRLIHDNFCNGTPWEIGLKEYAEALSNEKMTIYITPLKEGVNVNVESAMAARMEEVNETIGSLAKVEARPVYEMTITAYRGT